MSPASFFRRTVLNMPVGKYVMCCNRLCLTDSSIWNHAIHWSVILHQFSVEELSKLLTELKSLQEEWKANQLRLSAHFGQQKQLHMGTTTLNKTQRRNAVRISRNIHHSGVQEAAKYMSYSLVLFPSNSTIAYASSFMWHNYGYGNISPCFCRNANNCKRSVFLYSQLYK